MRVIRSAGLIRSFGGSGVSLSGGGMKLGSCTTAASGGERIGRLGESWFVKMSDSPMRSESLIIGAARFWLTLFGRLTALLLSGFGIG